MTNLTRLLVGIVIITFFGFFLVEAVLWTVPWVNGILLPQLNPTLAYPAPAQVETLKALFLNQGAYNLMLAVGGLYGLRLWKRGHVHAAQAMLSFLCLFGIGAALTLLSTTHAFVLGTLQLIVPALAFPLIQRDARHAR